MVFEFWFSGDQFIDHFPAYLAEALDRPVCHDVINELFLGVGLGAVVP